MNARVNPYLLFLSGAAALALAACGQGAQGPPATHSVNPVSPNYGTLQFAVGTANIYGQASGLQVIATYRQSNGLSAVLVSTPQITGPFSISGAAPLQGCAGGGPGNAAGQPDFTTAFGGTCPTLGANGYTPTFPPTPNAASAGATTPSGPSGSEILASSTSGTGEIEGTPQSVRPTSLICDSTTPCTVNGGTVLPNTTTFGQSGGVFGMGLMPANSQSNGTAFSYSPYPLPLYDDGTLAAGPSVEWGGPPAYPGPNDMGDRDGTTDLGAVNGAIEGMTVFENVTQPVGTYTLNLTVPTGQSSSGSSSYATLTRTANIASSALLPAMPPAALLEDGNGGATEVVVAGTTTPYTLPAGVTEAIVNISDVGPTPTASSNANCQGTLGPSLSGAIAPYVSYTVVIEGGSTGALGDTLGPNINYGTSHTLQASPTLCTATANTTANGGTATPGDIYSVQVIGLDFPLYEASQQYGKQAPTITGANGQADISIGVPVYYQYGVAGPYTGAVQKLRKPARLHAVHLSSLPAIH
ncbi:MAG TPA: hypothetical protein VMD91_18185 [Candidatus Sulfotelmatobacter sp.]|nr:hypothetical protein [Candidatus Sulfotelmatobacter sp.]